MRLIRVGRWIKLKKLLCSASDDNGLTVDTWSTWNLEEQEAWDDGAPFVAA